MRALGRSALGILGAARLCRAVLAAATLCVVTSGARADAFYDPVSDEWFWGELDWDDPATPIGLSDQPDLGLSLIYRKPPPLLGAAPEANAAPASIPADIRKAIYQVDNSFFTIANGEPRAVPAMKRTGWRLFVPDRSGRVVVSTYGSSRFGTPLDTAVGVYRKTGVRAGKLIARNDNLAVSGGVAGASFTVFDAVKNKPYAIQFGDVANEGGDVLLTVSTFGSSAGGLVAQPTSPYDGYDYSCTRNAGQSGSCQPKDYVIYNATKKALRVTTSATGLGAGATFPKAFVLKPGAAALKTIAFGEAFGSNGKALSGGFAFEGASGGDVVSRAIVPARIAVHDVGATAATLRIESVAQTVAVAQSSVVAQVVKVSNIGSVAAKGCYVKPGLYESLVQTAWAGYDARKDVVSTQPYTPFSIAPGETSSIVVAMRSLRDRLADPGYNRPFEIACAGGPSFPSTTPDLTNVLDFTASVKSFAKISLVKTSPKSGVLNIPSKGAVMTATFRNDGKSRVTLTANAVERSAYPFGDPKRYKISLCPKKTTDAACLSSSVAALDVVAGAGKTVTLKVAVKPPAEDPGYNPGLVGVALTLSQPYSDTFPTPIPVSGVTKALKLQ